MRRYSSHFFSTLSELSICEDKITQLHATAVVACNDFHLVQISE